MTSERKTKMNGTLRTVPLQIMRTFVRYKVKMKTSSDAKDGNNSFVQEFKFIRCVELGVPGLDRNIDKFIFHVLHGDSKDERIRGRARDGERERGRKMITFYICFICF